MKAFSRFGPFPRLLSPFVVLALFSMTACATTQLAEEDASDAEAVNIGYGTIEKDHQVGAVSTVQARDESSVDQPRTMAEMLRRVPGVQVMEYSGGRISVRIRGTNTLQGGREPLYVMDGMVVQGIDAINPMNIESITVLKNADATAVYGSRGANGVILIRSKR